MNNDYMTLNKYARHRGISTTTVRKAIKEGRVIPKKVRHEYRINTGVAYIQWADNTDKSKPLN